MQLSPTTERIIIILSATLTAFLYGAACAQFWLSHVIARTRAFSLIPDIRPRVCTVTVDGVVDGKIEGTLTGSGRVFIGDEQAFPKQDGSFSVAATPFLTQKITVTIPEGVVFVASKKGSKIYPVKSTQGQKIAPENRVYFKTREEAERAGYHP